MNGLGSDNLIYQPIADNSRLSAKELAKIARVKVSTLRTLIQEKGEPWWNSVMNPAWFDWIPQEWCTCNECPQKLRSHTYRSWNPKRESNYETIWVNTVRCRECNRLAARHRRKREKMNRLLTVDSAGILQNDLKFVTLTIPNIEFKDLDLEVKALKKRVRTFCKKSPKILGGYNFYEWTIHPDDRAWSNPQVFNLHHHGIWFMQYYDQRELQKDWGYRTDIRSVSRSSWGGVQKEQLIKYVTKYSNKADVLGKRLAESFGCLRGSAYRAIEESVQQLKGES